MHVVMIVRWRRWVGVGDESWYYEPVSSYRTEYWGTNRRYMICIICDVTMRFIRGGLCFTLGREPWVWVLVLYTEHGVCVYILYGVHM